VQKCSHRSGDGDDINPGVNRPYRQSGISYWLPGRFGGDSSGAGLVDGRSLPSHQRKRFRQCCGCQGVEETMKKFLISAAAATIRTGVAYAQAAEFSKKCTMVDKKPTTTSVVVGDGKVFKTRAEETGMKAIKV
jgi:hypothetical protein